MSADDDLTPPEIQVVRTRGDRMVPIGPYSLSRGEPAEAWEPSEALCQLKRSSSGEVVFSFTCVIDAATVAIGSEDDVLDFDAGRYVGDLQVDGITILRLRPFTLLPDVTTVV